MMEWAGYAVIVGIWLWLLTVLMGVWENKATDNERKT